MREHALALKKGESGRFAALDELPGDWWSLAENEPGGYQYRTVVQVLGRRVECMLDGCAGANHVTEELLVGMLNRAAELGIGTEDPRFPVVKLEKWVHPEFVHGIASGAPVPLKGAAVLRVTLLEGKTPEEARAGPEIFVRCKIAARGSSDWHGLILGGRALDCASRMGLGFRPGPEHHILDTLSIRIPRCEDYTRVRKDRAYAFEARLSSLDGAGCFEPGGAEPLELAPGDGVLVPVEREVQSSTDGSLTEAVFPVDCGVEAVPGLWTTGAAEGFVLLAAQELDHTLEPGDVVAEVRSGLVETAACDCGAVETNFFSVGEEGPCETCGVAKAPESSDGCFCCGCGDRTAVRSYQGCSSCARTRGRRSAVEDPAVVTFLGNIPEENSWWDAPGGVASVWGRRFKADELSSPTVKDQPFETCLLQRSGEAWRLWDTRDLRSGPSVALSGDVPVTERLAVFRTRRAPKWAGWVKGSATSGLKGSAAARDSSAADTASNPSYHIVESWDIEKMMEEPPTDYYYDRLSEDLRKRHPQADSHLIDHLVSLEAFLDKSILFGFSFGINKAEVAVAEGKLLGHKIGRSGSSPDEERCQAVVDFPPLREKLHIQQFLGCANWLRGYLPAEYGHAAKVLGQWQKPGAEFPEGGLGAGATAGCKAFKAIKQMMQRHICLASFDEAAAADIHMGRAPSSRSRMLRASRSGGQFCR